MPVFARFVNQMCEGIGRPTIYGNLAGVIHSFETNNSVKVQVL